jgi:transcriptional regulator with XRE-family HTH domain
VQTCYNGRTLSVRRDRTFHPQLLGEPMEWKVRSRVLDVTSRHSIAHECSLCQVAPHAGAMLRRFSDKLRYLRTRGNFTQTDLAQTLGEVTRPHLSHLESGRKLPSLALVVRIADLFSIQTDYLLRDEIPVDQSVRYAVVTGSQQRLPFQEQFGQKLRQLRMQQAMTQGALADRLSLASHSHVSFLEGGRKEPSIELVLQIADLFGVTTEYLLRGDLAGE